MYNKEFYKQVFDLTCPYEDLSSFCIDIDEKEFDLDNSFDKYYDLSVILKAIEKCENNEIDSDYLASWCMVYNWIIMATEWDDCCCCHDNIESVAINEEFEDVVINEISDLLDSLSFYSDEDRQYYNLKKFKNTFKYYDNLYRQVNALEIFKWDVFDMVGEEGTYYLSINHETKEFYTTTFALSEDDIDKENDNNKVSLEEIENKIADLKTKEYKYIITSKNIL